MGFPVGYSDLFLPKLVLHLLLLLGAVRRFLLWFFRAVGLGDLLELDSDLPFSPSSPSSSIHLRRPEFKSVPSVLIEEVIPVMKFEDLLGSDAAEPVRCAVCLCDVAGSEEVRRLKNCSHVFHRGCLDKWMEHDQHTCPLCRAKLIPDELGTGIGAGIGAGIGTGGVEVLDYDYFFSSLPSSPVPSPVMFHPHELLGTGF